MEVVEVVITGIEKKENRGGKFLVIETEGREPASGFIDSKWNKDWKVGDKVEVKFSENGRFLNYFHPDYVPKTKGLFDDSKIMAKLDEILSILTSSEISEDINSAKDAGDTQEDLPF